MSQMYLSLKLLYVEFCIAMVIQERNFYRKQNRGLLCIEEILISIFCSSRENFLFGRTKQELTGEINCGALAIPLEVNKPFVVVLLLEEREYVIAAMTSDGILEYELTSGSVNADKFLDFIRGRLVPSMQQFPAQHSILVLDNCAIHHTHAVKNLLNLFGVPVFFLRTVQTITPLKSCSAMLSISLKLMMILFKQLMILLQLFILHFKV